MFEATTIVPLNYNAAYEDGSLQRRGWLPSDAESALPAFAPVGDTAARRPVTIKKRAENGAAAERRNRRKNVPSLMGMVRTAVYGFGIVGQTRAGAATSGVTRSNGTVTLAQSPEFAAALPYLQQSPQAARTLQSLFEREPDLFERTSKKLNDSVPFFSDSTGLAWAPTQKEEINDTTTGLPVVHSPAALLYLNLLDQNQVIKNFGEAITLAALPHPAFAALGRKNLVERFNAAMRELPPEALEPSWMPRKTLMSQTNNVTDTSPAGFETGFINGVKIEASITFPSQQNVTAVKAQIAFGSHDFRTRAAKYPQTFNATLVNTISDLMAVGANLTTRYAPAYATKSVTTAQAAEVDAYTLRGEDLANRVVPDQAEALAARLDYL